MGTLGKVGGLGAVLSWLITLVIFLAALGIGQLSTGAWLRDQTASWLFQLRGPRQASDSFAVVEIGHENEASLPASIATISADYAMAVRALSQTGAAGVVIVTSLPQVGGDSEAGVLLTEHEAELVQDGYARLAAAISEARDFYSCPVYLAAGEGDARSDSPADVLVAAAGGASISVGTDPIAHRHAGGPEMCWLQPWHTSLIDGAPLSLPLLAARLAQSTQNAAGETAPMPEDVDWQLAVNFVGPAGSFPGASYEELLAGGKEHDDAEHTWAGRVVLLGRQGWPDGPFISPYAVTESRLEMYRAEIIANMADTLLLGCGVRELPTYAFVVLLILCLVFSTLGIIRLPTGFSLAADVLIIGVIVVGTYGLFLQYYLVPASTVVLALVINSLVLRVLWGTIALRVSFAMQRRAQYALRERETLLRAVLDTNPTYMHVRDADGKVMLANQRFAALFTARPEQCVGQTLEALCASVGRRPVDSNTWLAFDRDVIDNQRFVTTLEQVDAPRGTRWYQTSKMPLYADNGRRNVLVISEDVTRLVRTEEELRHEHSLLEGVFTSVPEMVFAVDREMRLINANPAYLEEIGLDIPMAEAKGIGERLFHHEQRCRSEQTACPACRVLATSQPLREDRALRIEKHAERQLEITATPLMGSDGQLRGVVQVARDVTRQRSMERQLRVSQKLEAIGTLAGGIAHDFNNILTGIIGFTEMAMHGMPHSSEERELLEEVLRAGQRASELVKQILVFSRKSDVERQPVHLQQLVKEVLSLLRASLPATITIRQDIDPKAGRVLADLTQMHQMVMNLCTNAAQAMSGNDEIMTVSVKQVDVDEELAAQHLGLSPGKHVCLSVTDTGQGIPLEIRDRIFEPFFTTKEPEIGTGMGLATVHGIVSRCGGIISVESEVGVGSAFTVFLPCVEITVDQPENIEYEIPRGPGRVLVVEDEPTLAELMAKRLTAWGFDVEVCTLSLMALDKFREDPAGIDLVITDQTMPKLTGAELAVEMLQIHPQTRVILCTGFSGAVSAEQAQQLGICEYMMKPITERALADVVSRVLGQHKAGDGST